MPALLRMLGTRSLFAVMLVIFTVPALASADEVPENIRKAWTEREQKSAQIEIHWKGTETWFRSENELVTGKPDPLFVPKAYSRGGTLLLDNDKYRKVLSGASINDKYSEIWDVFDGKQSYCTRVPDTDVVPRQTSVYETHKPFKTMMSEDNGYDPLYWAVRPSVATLGRRPGWTLAVSEEVTDAGRLITLTESAADGKGGKRIYWVHPDTLNIVRSEFHSSGTLLLQYEAQYGLAEATWIPKSWTHGWNYSPDKGPFVTKSFQTEKVSFPKEVAAERFDLKLTPGLVLIEHGVETRAYRIDADGKKVALPNE